MKEAFDRTQIQYEPLSARKNRLDIEEIAIMPEDAVRFQIPAHLANRLETVGYQVKNAVDHGAPVICALGAHAIKNGLGALLKGFIAQGWFTHLATNGAGIIHDWEFSYLGKSSEDVRVNVLEGKFGIWEETGFYINLALIVGAYEGKGYGEAVGSMIAQERLFIPEKAQLESEIQTHPSLWKRAAAADLLDAVITYDLPTGEIAIPHPWKQYSVQSAAYELGIPFTGHPMFGHDIIYTHKLSKGAAVGRTAELDFLSYANSVSRLDGGVYLSVGSSVMSPMIFEKSLSMARNVSLQEENSLTNFDIVVVDLQPETWDWCKGEPPEDNPAYYHRFMKTFNRMGCPVSYICADNRDFFMGLYQLLSNG